MEINEKKERLKSLLVFWIRIRSRILVEDLFDESLDLANRLQKQILVAYVQNDEDDDENDAQYDDHDNRELNEDRIGLQFGMRMLCLAMLRGLSSFTFNSYWIFTCVDWMN